VVGKGLGKERFRVATVERDGHGQVVFIAVLVDHDHDFFQLGEDDEGTAVHQMWVLQGDVGRQQRFRHAAPAIHGVEAVTAVQIADEINAVADNLRHQKEPRGQKRFDAFHGFLLKKE
jgi:hypothetical protein